MVKTRIRRFVMTALLAIGIVVAFAVFIRDNSDRIYRQNEEYLNELTTQRAISVDSILAENLSFIRSTADLYGKGLTSRFASVALIRNYAENSVFEMLNFIDLSGDNYTRYGVQDNLADRDYFQAGMRGESGITYISESRVTGQKQIGFYAPVVFEDEVIGVMAGFYDEKYIENVLDYELFGYEGEGWLVAGDGTIMGATTPVAYDNFFDFLAETGRCAPSEIERMRAAFRAGEKIAFTYTENGIQATGYAVDLKNQDWMLIRSFPPAASQQILRNANGEGTRLIVALTAMFALFSILLVVDFLIEARRARIANRDAKEVSTAVSRLFDAFVGIDLKNGRYRYLQGRLPEADYPREGLYEELMETVLKAAPDAKARQTAREVAALEPLRARFRQGERVNLRLAARIAGAEWMAYDFIVTHRENGEAVRAVIGAQDATAQHAQEAQEQLRLQQALNAAEKASRAKTDFLFNMSHDLRTPMNAIIGYTALAQREGVALEQMRGYVGKIDSSSKHLLALINDILEMSRVESGKMTLEPVAMDLRVVMRETEELFATQMAEKGIDFRVDASEVRDPWVLCDPKRLDRVILNLVSNAFKFTLRGGAVTATLRQTGRDGARATFELRVRDSGIGMSPEFATKLFTPFERERTSTVSGIQGTGLGLSITKSIIDLMGGTVEVATEQGKGTEFTVRLAFPVAEPPPGRRRPNSLPGTSTLPGCACSWSRTTSSIGRSP